MAKPKKPKGAADDFRPSKAVGLLREALGLDEDDWKSFLFHARIGLAEYEQATDFEPPDTPLRLRDVPGDWLEEPVAIGYVFLRVVAHGKKTVATSVAKHLLQMLDPDPFADVPPGTGLAWLHLAREGMAPLIVPDPFAYWIADQFADFYHGVAEDDLLPLARLILESRNSIEAWDLHAVLKAMDRAGLDVHACSRLFDGLMAAEWISADVKREFCRGLLGCAPEVERFAAHRAAIRATLFDDDEPLPTIPPSRANLRFLGPGWDLPSLQRNAVYALVENLGDPLDAVLDEFFSKTHGHHSSDDAVTLGALDLIGLHAEELGPDVVRRFLVKAVKSSHAPVRQAAYRVGADRFGLNFARPALKDEAARVRNWAAKVLESKVVRPARKAARNRRARSTGQQPGNTSKTP
jgi:hypothetical protein